jgi:hypothetical protein
LGIADFGLRNTKEKHKGCWRGGAVILHVAEKKEKIGKVQSVGVRTLDLNIDRKMCYNIVHINQSYYLDRFNYH